MVGKVPEPLAEAPIKWLSEPRVTKTQRFSMGVVLLHPGKGHARHNHPGSEEVLYVVSGQGKQMIDMDGEKWESLAAGDLVPGRAVRAAAEELVAKAREEPFVRLAADGLQCAGAVAGGVEADCRDAARRDRQLQA